MATSIFFDGRVISVPGSYSRVDASGLEPVGLSAAGIVAVLGTAEGGVPAGDLSEFSEIPRYNNPQKMKAAFRSGQLLEVADMLFAPAKDPDILAGAQEVLALKVNPSTQSTAQLMASGLPQIDVTSRDYGEFTSQINVDVQAGTTKGKALTVKFEGVVETVDDLGGDAVFTLQYVPGSYGYNTAVAAVNAAGDVTVTATRASTGKSTDITNPATNNTVEIAGSNQTGAVASVTTVAAGVATLTGLTGMTAAHVGRTITVSGAASGGNNGTFTFLTYISPTSMTITNANAVAADANNGAISWVVSDAGILVTVYGLVGTVPTKETLTMGSAVTVTGSVIWDAGGVLAVVLDKAPVASSITVKNSPGGTTIFTIATAQISKGAIVCENCFVEKVALSSVLDAAGAHQVLVFGKDQAGTALADKFTTNGTTPVVTTATTWAQIDVIAVGNVPVARTLTVTATAAKAQAAVQDKLYKIAAYFETKQRVVGASVYGFVFAYGTGKTSFLAKDLDIVSNKNVLSPATGSFTADLYAIVAWINTNSQLISAEENANASAVPDNTVAPVFLTGGVEGTALFSHYQAALNLLKKGIVNSIVDLSGDPAVAAALDAHCAYMCGVGRAERDGFVGLLNSGMTDVPSKTELKAQVVDINSRHIRAWAQGITRFNAAGDKQRFLPPYGAALLAGAQAGAPVGTSLTFKYLNVLALDQHSSWNPTDDAEELIQAGLVFGQNVEGVGRRVVRNVTTHLSSNNLAFIEGSVNQAVNFAVFNLRTRLEVAVGKRGFSGTVAATRAVAVGTLGLLTDEDIITAWRSLFIELLADVMDVSCELAPVIPVNFVRTTVHLFNQAQTAAA